MFEHITDSLKNRDGGEFPFTSHIRALKEWIEVFRENKRMSGDILFMITYMASITTSQVSRPEIFAYTASRKEYAPTKYFEKVEFFVKRWGYSYAEGLKLVAERTRSDVLRSMLNRYGNSIDSGIPDEDFLRLELSTTRSIYRNAFEQGIEMLRKWGDAYIALMLSATIVGIIIMVSVAIYAPTDINSTLNLSYMIIIMIAVFGLLTMYRSIPEDRKTRGLEESCSYEQRVVIRLERFLVPLAAIGGVIMLVIGVNPGITALFVSVLFIPLGYFGFRDDLNIMRRDEDFYTFIRGLGSIMGGKGLTMAYALSEVDRKSLDILGPSIDGVYTKLNLGLDEGLVWNRFIRDSGSNLISKYLNIFRDSVALGGSPAETGKIVGSSMLEQVLLRKKREMLSTGFIVLLVPMHVAMISIYLFLFEILVSMSQALGEVYKSFGDTGSAFSTTTNSASSVMGSIGVFTDFPEDRIRTFVAVTIFLITISNVVAGKIVKGGDRYMYYFFGSLLFGLTGIMFIVTPLVVRMFFQVPVF